MIAYIGSFLVLLAFLNALLLVFSRPLMSGVLPDYKSIILSSSKLQFPLTFFSFICLIFSFLTDDFSLRYVSSNSNSLLPYYYKISATWAGHEGSMLLWCLVLSFWTFLASIYSRSLDLDFRLKFLSNGLDVKIRNAKNPRFNKPIMDKKFSLKSDSKLRLYMLARNVQKLKTKHHNNIDPS